MTPGWATPELMGCIVDDRKEVRKRMAHLPIEEKVKMLVEMQRLADRASRERGGQGVYVWEV
jgi:hypothetical protein